MVKMSKEPSPKAPVCKECITWKLFKDKCYFYWENKKECSQFRESQTHEPKHKTAPDHEEWKNLVMK